MFFKLTCTFTQLCLCIILNKGILCLYLATTNLMNTINLFDWIIIPTYVGISCKSRGLLVRCQSNFACNLRINCQVNFTILIHFIIAPYLDEGDINSWSHIIRFIESSSSIYNSLESNDSIIRNFCQLQLRFRILVCLTF